MIKKSQLLLRAIKEMWGVIAVYPERTQHIKEENEQENEKPSIIVILTRTLTL